MRRKGREKIVEIVIRDGVETTRTERYAIIYTKKDGEYVNFLTGHRKIERRDGVPTLVIQVRSVKATSFADIKAAIDGKAKR
jgi:hypothetical protein